MSRYIDADAYAAEMKTRQDACRELIYAAEAECNEEMYDRNSAKFGIFVEAKLTLDAMPTVDAVPVVRCGECKHFIEPSWECRKLIDRDAYGEADARVYPDYFCADGERKDGAE